MRRAREPEQDAGDLLPYLAIPESYFAWLGGLRWSEDAEAIEYRQDRPGESRTFAMLGEVALFLEGFATSGAVLCFGHALHFLDLLGAGRRTETPDDDPPGRQPGELRRIFRECGRPFRNAGALAAVVGAEVPRSGRPIDIGELCRVLQEFRSASYRINQVLAGSFPEAPPLAPLIFSARVLKNLAAMDPDEIRHWLKTGRPPSGAREEIAGRVDADRPRSFSDVLAGLERRPRMAASAALVGRILGALTIPPRRLSSMELPTGGYSDVATRGHPEQLLLSQFALEPTELLRRFAEKELLYFRREEPRTPVAEEMLIVVDQGVRTWGIVRSVLGAAALAMGRLADSRGIRFRAITTGEPEEIVDPLELGTQAFGERLESSDLSPHPAGPLEYLAEALVDEQPMPRDVILLAHARGLREPDVLAASAALPSGTRLFGVGVDDRGEVGLSELRLGGALPISRCRVPMPVDPDPGARPFSTGPDRPWIGEVEPIPFPFRLGIARKPPELRLDLDPGGRWLFVCGYAGVVHAWRVDDGEGEILPRGVFGGKVVSDVVGLVGVSEGVLAMARLEGELIAIHYDLGMRRIRAYPIGAIAGNERIAACYLPDSQCALIRWIGGPIRGLDLGQGPGEKSSATLGGGHRAAGMTRRCREVLRMAVSTPSGMIPYPRAAAPSGEAGPTSLGGDDWLAMARSGVVDRPVASLDPAHGALLLCLPDGWSKPWIPLSEGKPVLAGCRLGHAAAAGPVAAISATFPRPVVEEDRHRLFLFAQPAGRLIRVIPGLHDPSAIAISRDGQRVAFATSSRRVAVQDVAGQGEVRFATPQSRIHSRIRVLIGRDHLMVSISGAARHSFFHHPHRIIRWDSGILECSRHVAMGRPLPEGPRIPVEEIDRGIRSQSDRRYVAFGEYGAIRVAVDFLGQIIIQDRAGCLIGIFFIFRDDFAAWLPDGTRMGPASLIGGPPTPDAPRKIGQAMQAAGQRLRPGVIDP
ncbi:MAG: hypothetical protein U0800_01575 [Isosphaeraceae bacterium]